MARFSAAWYGRPAVLFPVNDFDGNLVAVCGRFVDSGRRLKTQAAGRISLGVFSTQNALLSTVIAVVEGPIDAISLALCGLPAVAILGTNWAEWLPQSFTSKRIFIATDADKVGDEAARRSLEAITGHICQPYRLRPSCGKDWNDVLVRMGSHSLRKALKCFALGTVDATRCELAQ